MRVVMIAKGQKLGPIKIRERGGDGKFVPVDRRWTTEDVAQMRLFAKAMTCAARDMGRQFDLEKLVNKINKPSPSRRRLRPTSDDSQLVEDVEAEWD